MYIEGDQLRNDTRTVDTKSLLDSAIEKYKSIMIKSPSPIYNRFNQNWRLGEHLAQKYIRFFRGKVTIISFLFQNLK